MTADLLETITAAARRMVEVRQQRESPAALAARAQSVARGSRHFEAALRRGDRINVIAECKRRSPSRGVLRAEYDPVQIARSYAAAGAAAISVLTEPTFFDGSLDHLAAIRAAVDVPLLRKDFIVSEYQLLEAKACGADAVLLIAAALRPVELRLLVGQASRLELDALVEIHSANELSIAIDAGARLIGVNNRDLRTLEVDTQISEQVVGRIPRGATAISESGLRSPQDLVRLRQLGYRAFLIGEHFMSARDPGAALHELLERCDAAKDTVDTRAQR